MSTEDREIPPENEKQVKKRLKKLQNQWIRTLSQEPVGADRDLPAREDRTAPGAAHDERAALVRLVRSTVHSEIQLMHRELTEELHRELEKMRKELESDLAVEFERTRDEVKLNSSRRRMFR